MLDTTTLRIADHPVDPLFVNRHSPRALGDAPLAEAEVLSLLEAGRWAPSASNHQPWRFVYALRGEPGYDAILSALVPFNQAWAGKAAALLVIASATTATNKQGQILPNSWVAYDTGAAAFSIALQAHLRGLVAHQMGGYDARALAEAVRLPADFQLNAVMALGYPGDPAALPDHLRAGEAPNTRRPLAELARRGTFGG